MEVAWSDRTICLIEGRGCCDSDPDSDSGCCDSSRRQGGGGAGAVLQLVATWLPVVVSACCNMSQCTSWGSLPRRDSSFVTTTGACLWSLCVPPIACSTWRPSKWRLGPEDIPGTPLLIHCTALGSGWQSLQQPLAGRGGRPPRYYRCKHDFEGVSAGRRSYAYALPIIDNTPREEHAKAYAPTAREPGPAMVAPLLACYAEFVRPRGGVAQLAAAAPAQAHAPATGQGALPPCSPPPPPPP
eukprot:364013-Chlamydomonas_euryale.AAC.5